MSESIASSGTMIAAALETVGYHYQSHILDALIAPGALPIIAAFAYVICGIIALVTFVRTGEYKFALWFLFGPGLFYFVTIYRVESSGTNWMFGDEARNQEVKDNVVRESIGYAGTGEELPVPKVAWFFSGFNDIISYTSRGLVDAIMSGRKDADLRFMVRAPLYGAMVTSTIDDKNFSELLHVALLRNCRDVYQASMRVHDETLSESDKAAARIVLDRNHFAKYTDGAAQYVAGLWVDYRNVFDYLESGQHYSQDRRIDRSSPFVQLPHDDLIKKIEQDRRVGRRTTGFLKDPENPNRQKYISEIKSDLMQCGKKDDSGNQMKLGWLCTCESVWNFTYVGLHIQASQVLDSKVEQIATPVGIDTNTLYNDWMLASGYQTDKIPEMSKDERKSAIYRVIAKNIFRNEVVKGAPGAMIADLAKRGQEFKSLAVKGDNELSTIERMRLENLRAAEKTQAAITAASMPYYQGLLLYLLGLSYPFFCFLLLIPGRHSSYLLFFSLWFWVKTWDVGFAIVMLLDEVFFTIFTGGMQAQHSAQGTSPELSGDLGLAIAALGAADPTFNMATYQSVISIAINSVPIVTGYIVLITIRNGAGLIAEGASGFADVFKKGIYKTDAQYGVYGYRRKTLVDQYRDVLGYHGADTGGRVGVAHNGQGYQVKPVASMDARDPGINTNERSGGVAPWGGPWGGYSNSMNDLNASRNAGAITAGASAGVLGNLRLNATSGVTKTGFNGKRKQSQAFQKSGDRASYMLSAAKFLSSVGGTIRDVSAEAHDDRVLLLAERAAFDSMTSIRSVQALQFSRVYDVFELPFADAETDPNQAEWKVMLNDNLRFARFVGDIIDASVGLGTDIYDRKYIVPERKRTAKIEKEEDNSWDISDNKTKKSIAREERDKQGEIDKAYRYPTKETETDKIFRQHQERQAKAKRRSDELIDKIKRGEIQGPDIDPFDGI
jgi:hypothetical protein